MLLFSHFLFDVAVVNLRFPEYPLKSLRGSVKIIKFDSDLTEGKSAGWGLFKILPWRVGCSSKYANHLNYRFSEVNCVFPFDTGFHWDQIIEEILGTFFSLVDLLFILSISFSFSTAEDKLDEQIKQILRPGSREDLTRPLSTGMIIWNMNPRSRK